MVDQPQKFVFFTLKTHVRPGEKASNRGNGVKKLFDGAENPVVADGGGGQRCTQNVCSAPAEDSTRDFSSLRKKQDFMIMNRALRTV